MSPTIHIDITTNSMVRRARKITVFRIFQSAFNTSRGAVHRWFVPGNQKKKEKKKGSEEPYRSIHGDTLFVVFMLRQATVLSDA